MQVDFQCAKLSIVALSSSDAPMSQHTCFVVGVGRKDPDVMKKVIIPPVVSIPKGRGAT